MSSAKNALKEHPLADKTVNTQSATTTSRSDSFKNSNSTNFKHQQFAKKRRESIIKMAPYIDTEIQPENERKLAIKCENVCLTYGEGEHTNYVLNGLSLSVPKGNLFIIILFFF